MAAKLLLGLFIICPYIALAHSSSNATSKSFLELHTCGLVREPSIKNPTSRDYKCRPKKFLASETALVLVDYWEKPDISREELVRLLSNFRKNGFHLIHGHGDAVLSHPLYQSLRAEVKNFLGDDYCRNEHSIGSSKRQELYSYGAKAEYCPDQAPPGYKDKISSEVLPPANAVNEHMVRYEDEMRYVLWKNKIKNLIYIGGGIDECMLHRPYGINGLVGIDSKRLELNIVFLEDFTSSSPTVVGFDPDEKHEILLKSLSNKLIKVANSTTLKFYPNNKK